MSDEEDDYMSDKYLTAEVRPSLIHSAAKKRQVKIATAQEKQIKRQRQESRARKGFVDNSQLQESLKQPIEAQNKGFQLLAKMGYKPGQALGKASDQADKRLVEPIGISTKTDRGGLGREAALRELAACRRQLREQRLRKQLGSDIEVTTEEFRRRATQKAEERWATGALKRSQLTCETLDTEEGITTPELPWFWPTRTEDNKDEASTETEETKDDEPVDDLYTTAEQLDMLTKYLRTAYKFCFWCGVRYTDQPDMDSNCPGETRDEH